jgi:hypothetical protein
MSGHVSLAILIEHELGISITPSIPLELLFLAGLVIYQLN